LRDLRERLILLEEPLKRRAETRALIEGDPEEGLRLVNEGQPLADLLWEEWGTELESAGMDRERFHEIARGYSSEIWLWAMGERPWEHCVVGLAGRVLRRLPRRCEEQELAGAAEVCR
jgi:hypothetical protein